MASRGRKPGFRMSEEHRTKIANSQILKRLIEHAEGTVDMSATQVQAGMGLLKKVLPDLSSVTVQGDEDKPLVTKEIGSGSAQLAALIEQLAERSGKAGEPSE